MHQKCSKTGKIICIKSAPKMASQLSIWSSKALQSFPIGKPWRARSEFRTHCYRKQSKTIFLFIQCSFVKPASENWTLSGFGIIVYKLVQKLSEARGKDFQTYIWSVKGSYNMSQQLGSVDSFLRLSLDPLFTAVEVWKFWPQTEYHVLINGISIMPVL